MPTILAFEFAATCFNSGISPMHATHPDAPTFKTTTPPLSESLLTVLPSSDLREKSGIVLPTTTSSGLTACALWQPDKTAREKHVTIIVNSILISLLLVLFIHFHCYCSGKRARRGKVPCSRRAVG